MAYRSTRELSRTVAARRLSRCCVHFWLFAGMDRVDFRGLGGTVLDLLDVVRASDSIADKTSA